jgi:hypothetical protein
MEFPKDLGGSSFRWNDSAWGGMGRFRPSPESDWYHYRCFLSQAILTNSGSPPLLQNALSSDSYRIWRRPEPHFAYPIILIKQGACF